MTAYFETYAQKAADNGYHVLPIIPDSKAPLGLDWSELSGSSDDVRTWLADGFTHAYWIDKRAKTRGTRTWSIRRYGVGVLAEHTPLVDIDVQDDTVSAHMVEFTRTLLGDTLERVGMAPKTGLLYRAPDPFHKVMSGLYLDKSGRTAKVEILGAGQQFVALAVHPDTKQPYRWAGKRSIHNTPAASLPTITAEQARQIRDEFDRVAAERGWQVVKKQSQLASVGTLSHDDPFADVSPRVTGVSHDEMHRMAMLVAGYDDYETWLTMGMALFHQYDGSDEGLDLWDEWSQQGSSYDRNVLHDKWSTFDVDGKGRQPITARWILLQAKDAQAEQLVEAQDDAIKAIMSAQDVTALEAVCKPLKTVAFSEGVRDMLIGKLRERFRVVSGTPLTAERARKMLRYEDADRPGRFTWLNGYVYVQKDETFFNITTGKVLTPRGFDATYSRNLLTALDVQEGKSVPEHLPQNIARNVAKVPVVGNRIYMPGMGDLFSLDGEPMANRFVESSIPKAAEQWTVAGRGAVERVEAHAAHLIENERDRTLFLDWLAYIVQTNQRPNWAVFLQGVGGDGKTFWGDLMRAVLGYRNAAVIRGAELKEKYTSWAEGKLFVLIEEVRLTGEHRYDAVNNLKPLITNSIATIRRMNVDVYEVPNRTAYMLTSNFKDGLPASEGDRYLVLYSRWQDEDIFDEWKRTHPFYYEELFDALEQPGALRKWLLERPLSPEFNPKKRAPDSSDMDEMRHLVADDDTATLKRLLDESHEPDFSRTLLDSTMLAEKLYDMGAAVPQGRRLAQLMGHVGMTFLGETNFGGRKRRWWSNEPNRFRMTDANGKSKINGSVIQFRVESL